jgi:hypothetical protein
MFDAVSRIEQPSLQNVIGEEGAEVPDMCVVVDGGPAAVEGDFAGLFWRKGGREGGREGRVSTTRTDEEAVVPKIQSAKRPNIALYRFDRKGERVPRRQRDGGGTYRS